MDQAKVNLQNSLGQKLVGLRAWPSNPCPPAGYPAVILAHGFGVTKAEEGLFDDLAQRLTKVGLAVYRFDFTGRGESEGDYSLITLTQLADDLRRIIEFVRAVDQIDPERIGLCGQSLGVATTIALAPNVKALSFLGGFYDVNSIVSNLFKLSNGFNPKGVSERMTDDGSSVTLQPTFWDDLKSNHSNLLDKIAQINAPTLFVWGSKDEYVPKAQVQALFDAKTIGPKELLVIEGANHGYDPERAKMYSPVVGWFQKYLLKELF